MADEASDLPGLPAGTAHCRLEEVVAYRAGRLPVQRAVAFESHLRGCAACRRLVRDAASVLNKIESSVRAVGPKASEVDLILARLRRTAVERATHPGRVWPRQPSQRFWLPVAGVLVVVVLIAVLQLLAVVLPQRWRAAHSAAAPSSSHRVAGSAVTTP